MPSASISAREIGPAPDGSSSSAPSEKGARSLLIQDWTVVVFVLGSLQVKIMSCKKG